MRRTVVSHKTESRMRRLLINIISAALLVSTARAQPSTVILVRHAERASQTDPDPVLSEAGSQRARDLAAALADAHVGTIITTQLQRTRLTAAPLLDVAARATIVVPTT